MTCSVSGCSNNAKSRGMCNKHYIRWHRHGDADINKHPNHGTGRWIENGYVALNLGDGKRKFEHVLMAEKALGRPLPSGAEVHHVDRDGTNNNTKSKWNLVLCPDHAYHFLLHKRARALGYEPAPRHRKISLEQFREIRESGLSSREIVEKFGISRTVAKQIRAGTYQCDPALALGGDIA